VGDAYFLAGAARGKAEAAKAACEATRRSKFFGIT
jgi:hypothetical protein